MFSRILFPTDFSDASDKALQFVTQLKGAGTEEVIVVHVVDERELQHFRSSLVATHLDYRDVQRRWIADATEKCDAIKTQLEAAGFKVEVRVEEGIPFSKILSIEEEENPAAVVIGSHGKSHVSEMLLGSVSEKVIRKSKHPVLVVR
jgi:nucleotide-binding universal stress UspA family protein